MTSASFTPCTPRRRAIRSSSRRSSGTWPSRAHWSSAWRQARSARSGVPEGVKDVVGRRLAALGERANHVLAIASVVGRRFGIDVLERLSGGDEDELIGALDDALAADLIAEEPGAPGRFAFTHALVRETAYEALSRTRRVRLHGRVGQGARRAAPRRSRNPTSASWRITSRRPPSPVMPRTPCAHATAAGERAMEQLAYEDAVGQLPRRARHPCARRRCPRHAAL